MQDTACADFATLKETLRLMAEIDKVITAHGGWPAAKAAATNPPPPSSPALKSNERGQRREGDENEHAIGYHYGRGSAFMANPPTPLANTEICLEP